MNKVKNFTRKITVLIFIFFSISVSAQGFWNSADIVGSYQIVNIQGIEGIHLQSINTKAMLNNQAYKGDKGTLSIWVSPLEELTFSKIGRSMEADFTNLTLVSDKWPVRNVDSMKFGFYWSTEYPQLISRFMCGRFWTLFDYGFAPIGYAEKLTLRPKQWYNLVMIWDKIVGEIKIYVNGVLIGSARNAKGFNVPGDTLYFGNPMMVFHDIQISENVISEKEIKGNYFSVRPSGNDLADGDIQMDYFFQQKPEIDIERDSTWENTYSVSFLEEDHLKEWYLQTGDKYLKDMDIRITSEGLLIKTPNIVAQDSRMYLWSPVIFEGDQWIEFDFKLESDAGLALLVCCTSGPQRNDFIDEGWMPKSGSMGFILSKTRNYHWEFMRRVEYMRRDMETQYLAKNPWGAKLHYGCIPKFDKGNWHHLKFIKIGNRLLGSIDGITVFDLEDNSFTNNGPVLNSGRIGIRQMYNTAMLYKNFEVYTRP